ncbi:hypothetical protein M8818_006691 [Zalaria obscura]|uniref:Uncharacterized protein n=1 Tax=Zalaria obscura TaxID=2024903 RepID=A0ACC3S4N4_9PEZI
MALSLPPELQQHIFDFLDPHSFYAARKVCRWWRYAASGAITLERQLNNLPIIPPPTAVNLGQKRLQSLWSDAAHSLMLGMRVTQDKSTAPSIAQTINKSKVTVSQDGRRAAALESRQITIHDLTAPDCPVIASRPINDLRTALGGGPWFKCAPTCTYELALSDDGALLAIALERTIQIYDMTAESDSWPVSSYIPSASGHFIAGLSFEHNNSTLRVQLSNKGTVIYLGTPSEAAADLEYWQEKVGLKHAFFDSSKTSVKALSASGPRTLAGVQLLRPFADGWLFAAQQHGGSHPSNYCIGYIPSSEVDGLALTAECQATILVDLPSFLSAFPLPLMSSGLWSSMPSAHEQHPHFSLSADGDFLALSEPGTNSNRAHGGSASKAFLYRLPGLKHLADLLERRQEGAYEVRDAEDASEMHTYEIQRMPLSLAGTVKGKMLDFAFVPVRGGKEATPLAGSQRRLRLRAKTEVEDVCWSLLQT